MMFVNKGAVLSCPLYDVTPTRPIGTAFAAWCEAPAVIALPADAVTVA